MFGQQYIAIGLINPNPVVKMRVHVFEKLVSNSNLQNKRKCGSVIVNETILLDTVPNDLCTHFLIEFNHK